MVLLALMNLGVLYYHHRKMSQTVVVDVIRVFNEFNLKKDLEKRVDHNILGYRQTLDSLGGLLQYAASRRDEHRVAYLKEAYIRAEEEFGQNTDSSVNNINEVVWARLNPLIDKFGRQNNYRLIIGANGMGSVLYNVGAIDKTTDLIQFINKEYEQGS